MGKSADFVVESIGTEVGSLGMLLSLLEEFMYCSASKKLRRDNFPQSEKKMSRRCFGLYTSLDYERQVLGT